MWVLFQLVSEITEKISLKMDVNFAASLSRGEDLSWVYCVLYAYEQKQWQCMVSINEQYQMNDRWGIVNNTSEWYILA